ncbi:hypothetical protein [Paenibacillus sp. LHD-38]|uniref:hypothetical protein n=1 Tax=Paenibacillus sp. LHD-38 TaxID=3072143 RepID=UPI00280D3076|nr:hypothetical protein [Paenibacillus sp. LHD-38]MDQ8732968.1 hypothetical protein [Paenibacillus sp. LHD-38]
MPKRGGSELLVLRNVGVREDEVEGKRRKKLSAARNDRKAVKKCVFLTKKDV